MREVIARAFAASGHELGVLKRSVTIAEQNTDAAGLRRHHKVERFVEPAEFEGYARSARAKGFLMVSASPLTRSSYHAGDDFQRLRDARQAMFQLSA